MSGSPFDRFMWRSYQRELRREKAMPEAMKANMRAALTMMSGHDLKAQLEAYRENGFLNAMQYPSEAKTCQ